LGGLEGLTRRTRTSDELSPVFIEALGERATYSEVIYPNTVQESSMKAIEIEQTDNEPDAPRNIRRRKWQRIILLCIIGCEAAGALSGGGLLVAAPDGRIMDMSVDMMHGVFRDFLIPGILLVGLGLLNAAAFVSVLRKSRADWVMAWLALGGLFVWFSIEIAILREIHWLHIVWGIPVFLGGLLATVLFTSRQGTTRKVFLICGILASLLYMGLNIFVPMLSPSYNSAAQTVSELSAIGAPTRPIWIWLSILYTLLMTVFAWGVWKSASRNRALRIAGALLMAYAALGFLWPFAPMHLRDVLAVGGGTISDTLHLALGAVTEILYLLALGFAAMALGKRFRFYSIATFVTLLVFGVLTFLEAPGVAANRPTPLIGVWERINIGVFLLWVVVLAVVLVPGIRSQAKSIAEIPSKNNEEEK
jgi:hypothetical protein